MYLRKEIEEARRIREKKYLQQEVVPQLVPKYTLLLKRKIDHKKIVAKQFKKSFSVTVNDPQDIPGVFRFRVPITDKNLEPPSNSVYQVGHHYGESKDQYSVEDAIHRSLLDQEQQLQHVLNSSKKEFEEQFYEPLFYYTIDIRVYGLDPEMPLIVHDSIYYLTKKQVEQIKKLWSTIDPSTSNGIRFSQDINYLKSVGNSISLS